MSRKGAWRWWAIRAHLCRGVLPLLQSCWFTWAPRCSTRNLTHSSCTWHQTILKKAGQHAKVFAAGRCHATDQMVSATPAQVGSCSEECPNQKDMKGITMRDGSRAVCCCCQLLLQYDPPEHAIIGSRDAAGTTHGTFDGSGTA